MQAQLADLQGMPGAQPGGARAALRVRVVAQLEGVLGRTVEGVAALLIAIEVGILLAAVIARYWLNTPLVWSDEVASLLFLWLAVLGAVIAFRRGEHMRMTALVARLSPERRALADLLAVAASLTFLVLQVPPPVQGHADS